MIIFLTETIFIAFFSGSKHVYMDPKCKIALITGGTTGVGFAAAQELLCNDLYVSKYSI